jgi:hypothetical protein
MLLVSTHDLAGDVSRARESLSELHRMLPAVKPYSIQGYSGHLPFKHQEHLALFQEGLRKAGVADAPE